MSGTFPTDPAPTEVKILSSSPTFVSVMHSLETQRRSRGGQRWGFELAWDVSRREDIATIVGFLAAQRGSYETFTFSPPCWYLQGTGNGTPLVDGGSQTGTTINLKGFDPSETVLRAGDFLQFAGHTKVYMSKSNVISDGTGLAAVLLNTPLVESPAADAAVSLHTPGSPLGFNVALGENEMSFTGQFDAVYELEVTMQEV